MKSFVATLIIISLSSCFVETRNADWKNHPATVTEQATAAKKLMWSLFFRGGFHPYRQLDTFVFLNLNIFQPTKTQAVPTMIDVDWCPTLVKPFSLGSLPTDVITTPDQRVGLFRSEEPKMEFPVAPSLYLETARLA